LSGINAYQKTQQSTENPRDVEYRLFAQVTSSLSAILRGELSGPERHDALDWNRRVWSTLAIECSDDANQLGEQLRAGIISLAIWVNKYTSEAIRDDADIEPLIDINRTIMEGLRPATANAGDAAAPQA